jgi:DNA polymerase III delta prime subunit
VNGPTADPCGVCENCVEIKEGRSFDVIEIDGASNNSVDDIRDLREKVMFAPVKGHYKVYIIDEVHMLSGAAFNALLKNARRASRSCGVHFPRLQRYTNFPIRFCPGARSSFSRRSLLTRSPRT